MHFTPMMYITCAAHYLTNETVRDKPQPAVKTRGLQIRKRKTRFLFLFSFLIQFPIQCSEVFVN